MEKNIELKIAGMPITVEQRADRRFRVTYWKQVKNGLTYAQAAREFGLCVFHALACEGKLNNEGP